MDFAKRPPSVNWEAVPVPECPPCVIWTWFKPQSAPFDVAVQIPPETHAACGPSLSMRRLLALIGLRVELVESWTVQGATFPVQQGANPLLDQPLPAAGPWGDPGISVRVSPTMQQTPMPPATQVPAQMTATAPMAAGDDHALRALGAYGSDWQALLTLETQLASVRKQLGAIQGQLQSLNRDLNPDEILVASSQDRKDWQDARRWLRDNLSVVSRWIRDHDIGMVSAAGNRNRFEQIYREHVVPKIPFPGLDAVLFDFEQHRKTAQNLLIQMQSAYQNASRDGVNRARQLLNRIGSKLRKAKEKRGSR